MLAKQHRSNREYRLMVGPGGMVRLDNQEWFAWMSFYTMDAGRFSWLAQASERVIVAGSNELFSRGTTRSNIDNQANAVHLFAMARKQHR